MLKKAEENKQDTELYLLNYRNSHVADSSYSPAQLMSSRVLRFKIPCNIKTLKPTLIDRELIYKQIILKTLFGKCRNVKFIKKDGNAVDLKIPEDNDNKCQIPEDSVKSDDASNVVLRKSERIRRPPNRIDL
ncbi:hypothetical protein ILUMI_05784 [Ignelater luminosus]|uniref:Uncharacterized protein n=1 Tax=Ignelater luminosus TaxID=2038154 RepID=A0A8K0DAG7_IGNLU|nr:hypothetical protein ILUMI_05784 [Ignelater luminosus]